LASGVLGQASVSRPSAQPKDVPGSPRIELRFCPPEAKYSLAARASAFAVAAYSPQTNEPGKKRSARSDWSHKPLASPSSAASHESSVIGAESGAFSWVDSIRP
jgi:hypothetical protein